MTEGARFDEAEFTKHVSSLLSEAIEIEKHGLKEPRFEDFHNEVDRTGRHTGPLHYPEPAEGRRPSSYDTAVAIYLERVRVRDYAVRAETEAKRIIDEQPQIRLRICEALKSVNEDVKDLAKILCAALVPLSLAGTLTLPLTPLLFLGIGLVVWRAGTNGFCAGIKAK
jgi:hypothetical protein